MSIGGWLTREWEVRQLCALLGPERVAAIAAAFAAEEMQREYAAMTKASAPAPEAARTPSVPNGPLGASRRRT